MKIKFCILFTVFLTSLVSADTPTNALVWADEFNTDGVPDPANWTYEYGFVRNNEAQWYQPRNAVCSNGVLIITGRREQVANTRHKPGSNDWRRKRDHAKYSSACLITKDLHSWQYGRFEMRARIDTRAGLWPAFWTLGIDGEWPDNGEIDIMEYYKGTLLANAFWGSGKPYLPKKNTTKKPVTELGDPGWGNQFHIWRMDWNKDSIKLYVDDLLLNEIDLKKTCNPPGHPIANPFRQPHYLLVNLAIGGNAGGDPSATEFPARFEIDYVRVYQKEK